MTNQPNKATVKDGLPIAEEVLKSKVPSALYNSGNCYVGHALDAMQEYSDQQNAELLAWKESAMRELNALDLQSLGRKLGIGLGQSVSENIHAKVDGLQERVKELESLMQEFVDRVDRGEVRSKKTYAKFKEALK